MEYEGSDKNLWEGMVIGNQLGSLYSWINADHCSPTTVQSFHENNFGLYGMAGNVAEFVSDLNQDTNQHFTKGGSWADTGYYLMCSTRQFYAKGKSASPFRGFRPVMFVNF